MVDCYVLRNRIPVSATTEEWALDMQANQVEHIVAKDTFGEIEVSTVFLGLDHSFWGGPPLLFETMVFGGSHDGEMDRYSTWSQAEEGHAKMVALVKGGN